MPCNAVATARAQVGQESLAKLLTDDVVRKVLGDYLKIKYPHLNPCQGNSWSGVLFLIEPYTIHIQNGTVMVRAGSGGMGNQSTCNSIASEITAFLIRTAGILFQYQTRQVIASRYAISEERRAPNGALVLSVEL